MDLPLASSTASSDVCAAATALHEKQQEQDALQDADDEQGPSTSSRLRQLRVGQSRVSGIDWVSDSTGARGATSDSAADAARQKLIDKVVGPMLDDTVQVVLPSVKMLQTCGEPIRLAAPKARALGIPLPVTAWVVDDVATACAMWQTHGATGVISNRAGMIAEAMASNACQQLAETTGSSSQ